MNGYIIVLSIVILALAITIFRIFKELDADISYLQEESIFLIKRVWDLETDVTRQGDEIRNLEQENSLLKSNMSCLEGEMNSITNEVTNHSALFDGMRSLPIDTREV